MLAHPPPPTHSSLQDFKDQCEAYVTLYGAPPRPPRPALLASQLPAAAQPPPALCLELLASCLHGTQTGLLRLPPWPRRPPGLQHAHQLPAARLSVRPAGLLPRRPAAHAARELSGGAERCGPTPRRPGTVCRGWRPRPNAALQVELGRRATNAAAPSHALYVFASALAARGCCRAAPLCPVCFFS